MPDDFLIARNPEVDTSLPYLLRIPLGSNGIVLKAREMWPRTSNVYGVPIVFCETRALAQEWTYRFLAAAVREVSGEDALARLAELPIAPAPEPAEPTTAQVRAWALGAGLAVSDRGRLRPEVWAAYESANAQR